MLACNCVAAEKVAVLSGWGTTMLRGLQRRDVLNMDSCSEAIAVWYIERAPDGAFHFFSIDLAGRLSRQAIPER